MCNGKLLVCFQMVYFAVIILLIHWPFLESQVKSAVVLGVAVASLDPASEAKSKLIKW
jgi:hypothetical protein